MIKVLDKGYVRLVNASGTDLDVVNAARASFNKESSELTEKDIKLIKYLARNKESSPFRHSHLTFEIYAPLMVARQWWKYAVGSSHLEDGTAWNETSRRYVTENNQYYIPEFWRAAPDNAKQGSGGALPTDISTGLNSSLQQIIDLGQQAYESALLQGVAPEQARLFLPAYGMYVRWRWTVSLAGVLHFLGERLAAGAQHEITAYAKAVHELSATAYPESIRAWL